MVSPARRARRRHHAGLEMLTQRAQARVTPGLKAVTVEKCAQEHAPSGSRLPAMETMISSVDVGDAYSKVLNEEIPGKFL